MENKEKPLFSPETRNTYDIDPAEFLTPGGKKKPRHHTSGGSGLNTHNQEVTVVGELHSVQDAGPSDQKEKLDRQKLKRLRPRADLD